MKVIFLDIDGVLQPYNSKNRFEKDRIALRERLSKEKGIDYSIYNEYDVAACALDWDKQAVERLKKIIAETDAKIVVSSDWRSERLPYKVRDLLSIWDLGKYWYADTLDYDEEKMKNTIDYIKTKNSDEKYIGYRNVEILDFVFNHKEITNFVAIDDMDISLGLENNFVHTYNIINDEQVEKCIEILNNEKGS